MSSDKETNAVPLADAGLPMSPKWDPEVLAAEKRA